MSVENSDYAALFTSPLGMKILQAMDQQFYDRGSFDTDPYKTAFNEGKRAVMIFIHNNINTSYSTTTEDE